VELGGGGGEKAFQQFTACFWHLQAKKITEIHAEAHAELGMMPTPTLPLFQALPALPASVI